MRRHARERLVRIPGGDGIDDLCARRDDLLDPVAGLKLEILHEREQQRVGHRHGQRVPFDGDGDAVALQRDFLRNQVDRCGIRGMLDQVDVREPELVRERLRNLALRRKIHPDQHGSQAFAGALVLDQGLLQVFFSDDPRLAETFTDHRAHGYPLADLLTHIRGCISVNFSLYGRDPIFVSTMPGYIRGFNALSVRVLWSAAAPW